MVKIGVEDDIFVALISSIISQQISTQAAITVKERLTNLIGEITAENINKIEVESIQKCGMSMRKAEYIKGVGEAVMSKSIDFDNLHKLEDNEIIKELTTLRGVGEWTAEMLLINSFQRPDILSYKDLGIRRGIMKLYRLNELSEKDIQLYRERYSPYCTVASIYLWEISGQK